jgi:hypothetical protein
MRLQLTVQDAGTPLDCSKEYDILSVRTTNVAQPDLALVIGNQGDEAELEPIRALGLNDAC